MTEERISYLLSGTYRHFMISNIDNQRCGSFYYFRVKVAAGLTDDQIKHIAQGVITNEKRRVRAREARMIQDIFFRRQDFRYRVSVKECSGKRQMYTYHSGGTEFQQPGIHWYTKRGGLKFNMYDGYHGYKAE